MNPRRNIAFCGALLAGFTLSCTDASGATTPAGQKAPAAPATTAAPAVTPAPVVAKDISVEIKVIHARKHKVPPRHERVDPRIRSIQKKLKRLFDFDSYRLVREEKVTLPPNVETPVKMPFRVFVRLLNQGMEKGKISLKVMIGQKQAVKLLLASGGNYLHVLSLKNNQSFILAITARTK